LVPDATPNQDDGQKSTGENFGSFGASSPDGTTFAELYESLAPSLYAWASLRIHPQYRSKLDPEDVVQDVWWRAMDAFARFDPEKASFRTWIFRIATNALTDGYRRLAVRGHLPSELRRPMTGPISRELAAQATSISRRAARSEECERLLASLSQLDRDERLLFAHCGLEGLSPEAAAPILGISTDAAVKRWQRLRARLRESAVWRDRSDD
jgi:RNA polymerase sigma factor (sigma-70 family)